MNLWMNKYLEDKDYRLRKNLLTTDYLFNQMMNESATKTLSLMQWNVIRWVQILRTANKDKMIEFENKAINTVFSFNSDIESFMLELQRFCKINCLCFDFIIDGPYCGTLFFDDPSRYRMDVSLGWGKGGGKPLYVGVTYAYFSFAYPHESEVPTGKIYKCEDVG